MFLPVIIPNVCCSIIKHTKIIPFYTFKCVASIIARRPCMTVWQVDAVKILDLL